MPESNGATPFSRKCFKIIVIRTEEKSGHRLVPEWKCRVRIGSELGASLLPDCL